MSTKVKKIKAQKQPPEPTSEEYNTICEECFYLPDWQFEKTLQLYCIEITVIWIGMNDTNEGERIEKAILYGLKGQHTETKQDMCATMFLRHGAFLYQVAGLDGINHMVDLLKKQFEYNQWQEKQEKKIHAKVTGKE